MRYDSAAHGIVISCLVAIHLTHVHRHHLESQRYRSVLIQHVGIRACGFVNLVVQREGEVALKALGTVAHVDGEFVECGQFTRFACAGTGWAVVCLLFVIVNPIHEGI